VPNRNVDDGYLWTRLAQAGKSFRNYGFYVRTDETGVSTATDPVLQSGTNRNFPGYDMACPDSSAYDGCGGMTTERQGQVRGSPSAEQPDPPAESGHKKGSV